MEFWKEKTNKKAVKIKSEVSGYISFVSSMHNFYFFFLKIIFVSFFMDIFDVPICPEAVGVRWIPFKILNYPRKRLSDFLIGTATFGFFFLQERTDFDDIFFRCSEKKDAMHCQIDIPV